MYDVGDPSRGTYVMRSMLRTFGSTSITLDFAHDAARLGGLCGINSAVECQLPKLKVAGSNPVSRSRLQLVARRG
ncbi:MAG: hypothetical protein JWL86_7049 [Rhizobium sp.]|nr:hypothetical protein [Rhizobium sp.]